MAVWKWNNLLDMECYLFPVFRTRGYCEGMFLISRNERDSQESVGSGVEVESWRS